MHSEENNLIKDSNHVQKVYFFLGAVSAKETVHMCKSLDSVASLGVLYQVRGRRNETEKKKSCVKHVQKCH